MREATDRFLADVDATIERLKQRAPEVAEPEVAEPVKRESKASAGEKASDVSDIVKKWSKK